MERIEDEPWAEFFDRVGITDPHERHRIWEESREEELLAQNGMWLSDSRENIYEGYTPNREGRRRWERDNGMKLP